MQRFAGALKVSNCGRQQAKLGALCDNRVFDPGQASRRASGGAEGTEGVPICLTTEPEYIWTLSATEGRPRSGFLLKVTETLLMDSRQRQLRQHVWTNACVCDLSQSVTKHHTVFLIINHDVVQCGCDLLVEIYTYTYL